MLVVTSVVGVGAFSGSFRRVGVNFLDLELCPILLELICVLGEVIKRLLKVRKCIVTRGYVAGLLEVQPRQALLAGCYSGIVQADTPDVLLALS